MANHVYPFSLRHRKEEKMGDISIKGKSKILLAKIADAFKSRGRKPSEWEKPKIKPKKRFNRGGKV